MKTKTTISGITHEDLVSFLSTALYGSEFWGSDYDSNEYNKLPSPDDCKCYEDKLAKLLLNGKSITICDQYAEDEEDFYGKLPHEWDDESLTMDYKVTLKDILIGFQRCLDGTFKANKGCGNEVSYMRKCMINLIDHENGDLDLPQASDIMQVVVFGQIVYG